MEIFWSHPRSVCEHRVPETIENSYIAKNYSRYLFESFEWVSNARSGVRMRLSLSECDGLRYVALHCKFHKQKYLYKFQMILFNVMPPPSPLPPHTYFAVVSFEFWPVTCQFHTQFGTGRTHSLFLWQRTHTHTHPYHMLLFFIEFFHFINDSKTIITIIAQ